MKFNKNEIIRLWSNGLKLMVNYKFYNVNKMNYGKFFLEPEEYNGNENSKFSDNTIWLIEDENNKNILICDNNEILK